MAYKSCVCLQTKEGTAVAGLLSSEMAAMLSFAIIPERLKHYKDDSDNKVFENHCRQHAVELGMAASEWPKITFPAFISMDWATVHPWPRCVVSVARGPPKDLNSAVNQKISVMKELLPRKAARTAPQPSVLGTQDLRACRHEIDTRDAYETKYGHAIADKVQWELALERPELWACVLPQQWMPLAKVSPDIHSPVEHMVRTVKADVKRQLHAYDFNSPDLWKGPVYQQFIRNAVQTKGRGSYGLSHIKGSVAKWPKVCQILAAEPGEELTSYHELWMPRAAYWPCLN
jgi:hypothetical protein